MVVKKLDCLAHKSGKCMTVLTNKHGTYINQAVIYACNPCSQEMEAEGSEVLGHPHLCVS